MKIVCSKSELVKGVNDVLKAVPTRTTMPILQCILIDASAGRIKLMANDMEIGIESIIEGAILERGTIALDASVFSNIVKKLPDSEVSIETESAFLAKIFCENVKFKINGFDGDDFPLLPVIERNESIVISEYSLKEVIRQTIFSIADNENNKIMTGELFEIRGSHLRVASLDGHRISIRNLELKGSYEDKKVIVPGKTLNEISKIIPGSYEDEVEIFLSDNHILFEFGKTTVVSRLIEGEYFKIDQMLSTDYETKIRISRRRLLESIDRVSPMINPGDKKPIIMSVTDGNILLHIESNIGEMNDDFSIGKEGKDIVIGFNPKFFMDALRNIDEEEISIYMVNPKSPCFIRDDENKFLYMILPVNIKTA